MLRSQVLETMDYGVAIFFYHKENKVVYAVLKHKGSQRYSSTQSKNFVFVKETTKMLGKSISYLQNFVFSISKTKFLLCDLFFVHLAL
jgi:hypothetical protein